MCDICKEMKKLPRDIRIQILSTAITKVLTEHPLMVSAFHYIDVREDPSLFADAVNKSVENFLVVFHGIHQESKEIH